jgi:hypothetical protein
MNSPPTGHAAFQQSSRERKKVEMLGSRTIQKPVMDNF